MNKVATIVEEGGSNGEELLRALRLANNGDYSVRLPTKGLTREQDQLHSAFNLLMEHTSAERELERKMAERTTELEAANADLEAFCYSVSHDLREPLRAISATSQILLEESSEKMDARDRSYLCRQASAARHMGNLIDDLLLLFRIGRVDLVVKPVSPTDIACAVREDLLSRDWDIAPQITVQAGMTLVADPGLLRICLANLMENACKYSSSPARIKVGMSNGAIYVSDTGEGFDMRHARDIFKPFHRLAPNKKVAGTGIGLAIVMRVVERHGGRVWAESQPGVGTTFFLKLDQSAAAMNDRDRSAA